jgi:hypothetical protein
MSGNERGHVALALLFALLLAAGGMALLTRGGDHLRVAAARCRRRLEASALEQALLLGLHRYREALAVAAPLAWSGPETGFFSAATFPAWSEDGIEVRHEFSCPPWRDEDGFRVMRVKDLVRARRSGGRLELAGRAGVELLAGDIPANELGLLVSDPQAADAAHYLADRNVTHAGSLLPLGGGLSVQADPGRLLCAALGLPGEMPDWWRIREAFGLPASPAPVPPGVYLARSEGDVQAVFVEGDLERLAFAAGSGRQEIAFERDGQRLEMSYVPGESGLSWSGGEAADIAGCRFAGRIVVRGSVWSLEQEGEAAFLADSRIELLASGRVIVATGLESGHLLTGAARLPKLLLMTCGEDFFGGGAVTADVVFANGGNTVVEAQVAAAGSLVNGKGSVGISGGVIAGGIDNRGSLRVEGTAGRFALGRLARLPGFKMLRDFRVEFIEERDDVQPQGIDGR